MASAHKMVTVKNRAGIHARPAALIAQTANKFASEVLIEKNDSTVINAKSIMGVITMAAGYNTVLTVFPGHNVILNELQCTKQSSA